jgi:hypothetical protein
MLSGSDSPAFEDRVNVTYSATTTSSGLYQYTENQQNRFLIAAASVGVQPGNGNDTTVTTSMAFGGVPMTSLGKVHSNNGTQGYVELFYQVGPTLGSNSLAVTASTSVDLRLFGVMLYNVDQANPVSNTQTNYGSSTSASVVFNPTLARSAVFGAMVSGTNISGFANGSPTGNQPAVSNVTQNFNNSSDGGCASAQLVVNPAASQTIGWTLANGPWAAMGVVINPTSYFPIGAIYGFTA